ncbi:hypothetical protein [Streptomyces sp. NPDC054842]
MTATDDHLPDADLWIRQLEGHLLVEAARAEGRAEAALFTGSLRWLTDTQREEVEARYAEHHLALNRRCWERTAERAAQLRSEYETLYRSLRRRLYLGVVVGAVLVSAAVLALAVTAARR